MGLPNFQYYYWACKMRALSFWNQTPDSNNQPAWVQMEQFSCQPSSACALLFSPMPLAPKYNKKKNCCRTFPQNLDQNKTTLWLAN